MPTSPIVETAQAALDTAAIACRTCVIALAQTLDADTVDVLVCAATACNEASRDLDERS